MQANFFFRIFTYFIFIIYFICLFFLKRQIIDAGIKRFSY